jgi:hypothetical protein
VAVGPSRSSAARRTPWTRAGSGTPSRPATDTRSGEWRRNSARPGTSVSGNASQVVATEEQQTPSNGTTDTSGGEVVALDPASGHPSIIGDIVMVRVASFDGATIDPVVAVDLASGKELWRYSEPYAPGSRRIAARSQARSRPTAPFSTPSHPAICRCLAKSIRVAAGRTLTMAPSSPPAIPGQFQRSSTVIGGRGRPWCAVELFRTLRRDAPAAASHPNRYAPTTEAAGARDVRPVVPTVRYC